MKATAYIRKDLAEAGLLIPSANTDDHYSQDLIDGSRVIETTDEGVTTLALNNGTIVKVESIDLDFETEEGK